MNTVAAIVFTAWYVLSDHGAKPETIYGGQFNDFKSCIAAVRAFKTNLTIVDEYCEWTLPLGKPKS